MMPVKKALMNALRFSTREAWNWASSASSTMSLPPRCWRASLFFRSATIESENQASLSNARTRSSVDFSVPCKLL